MLASEAGSYITGEFWMASWPIHLKWSAVSAQR
jgi:hypothetical protein